MNESISLTSNDIFNEDKIHDLIFDKIDFQDGSLFKLSQTQGMGSFLELRYHDGLFISTNDFVFNNKVERHIEALSEKFIEIIYLESGEIQRKQKGFKTIKIKAGINIFINNHKPMKIVYEENSHLKFVVITMFSNFYEKYIKEKFPEDNIDIIRDFKHMPTGYTSPELALIFRQLYSKMLSNFNNRLYFESKIGEIISIIIYNSNYFKKDSKLQNQSFSREDIKSLKTVHEILDNDFSKKYTIKELSKIAGMSPTKLKYSFRDYYNITIAQYSISVKLRNALILLANSDDNIKDIAFKVGYKNPSGFTKVFFEHFSIYPSDYRKLFKQ